MHLEFGYDLQKVQKQDYVHVLVGNTKYTHSFQCLDHSKEALEMARIQETTKQLEQQRKIKVI